MYIFASLGGRVEGATATATHITSCLKDQVDVVVANKRLVPERGVVVVEVGNQPLVLLG